MAAPQCLIFAAIFLTGSGPGLFLLVLIFSKRSYEPANMPSTQFELGVTLEIKRSTVSTRYALATYDTCEQIW